jgi:translation initiation factor IF-2
LYLTVCGATRHSLHGTAPGQVALAAQDENCRLEFKDRADRAILQLNEQGLNAALYWNNDDLAHTVSLVPTSAVTGEGVPDLLKVLFHFLSLPSSCYWHCYWH